MSDSGEIHTPCGHHPDLLPWFSYRSGGLAWQRQVADCSWELRHLSLICAGVGWPGAGWGAGGRPGQVGMDLHPLDSLPPT